MKYAVEENEVICGLRDYEIEQIKAEGSYNPWDIFNQDERIHSVMDSLFNGEWCNYRQDRFKMIFDEIMNGRDEYFILKDFDSYVKAQEKINDLYQDKKKWYSMALMNIANSYYFTSDRTIESYATEIWHLEKIK